MTLARRSILTITGGAVAAGVIGYLGRRQLASTLAPGLAAQPGGHHAIKPRRPAQG